MSFVKRIVPDFIKLAVKARVNAFRLKKCVGEIDPSQLPSDQLLTRISQAWGNESWSADISYLRAVCSVGMKCDTAILECGSGLTTLLLAIFAGKRGIRVLSLEHLPKWRHHIVSTLFRFHLPGEVVLSPLRNEGEFDWYTLPDSMPPCIGLVICDGPPASTRGGRVGVLPACRPFLRPGCVILMDDAERDGERNALQHWSEMGAKVALVPGTDGCYAQVLV
jgi:hypothetical protein